MPKDKELILRLAEAEKECVNAVNGILQQHGLPFFLFEPILGRVYQQVVDGKNSELIAAQARALATSSNSAENEVNHGD